MENSVIEIKNELIEWIQNIFDPEMLQKVMDLKNKVESSSLIAEINSEIPVENNFDEQFAAGMSSDELMENIASHIESINSEKSSVVSDTKAEYAVKDDFMERFAKGITSQKAREESKKRVREWWGK
jgi:metal-sulfur cluster biosynthetic enzyme